MLHFKLTPNHLTEDDNDFIAVVTHLDTLQIADIARLIIREGTESDEYTIIDLYRKMERMIIRQLGQGNMVDTDLYHGMATLTGNFKGVTAHFDPAAGHALNIALNICPPALKAIAEGNQIINNGVLQAGPVIGTVEDIYTRNQIISAARAAITPSRNLLLRGNRLRVAWDNEGTHPSDCGVFLVKTTTPNTRTRVPNPDIVRNTPTELMIIVPALTPGTYWLEVVTQSTGANITQLVKEPRTVRFHIPLTVENE